MTYNEFIQDILESRGRFACGNKYHERHHIIPKCMDGSNDEDNLIDLYAREHFIAHQLLVEENPENRKLVIALHCMATMSNSNHERYKITPDEYEKIRIEHSKSLIGENNFWYGKHPTEETRQKMRDSWNYEKHFTESARRKMSESRTGEKHPRAKKIAQYSKNGQLIKIWNCMTDAANETNTNVSKICECCNGTRKSSNGFIWKYVEEDVKESIEVYNDCRDKPVLQYSLDGTFIKEWPSAINASNSLGICAQSICSCRAGKKCSAGGFLWKNKEN